MSRRFIASTHILAMPRWAVGLPILLPTLYLWECDARALQRGTWVIEKGTKVGLAFRGLEIECVLPSFVFLRAC